MAIKEDQSSSVMNRTLNEVYGKSDEEGSRLHKSGEQRKYFDSGDYALAKSLSSCSINTTSLSSEIHNKPTIYVGTGHPRPESIPHASHSLSGNNSGTCSKSSPIRAGVISADDLASLVTTANELFTTANDPRNTTNNNQD